MENISELRAICQPNQPKCPLYFMNEGIFRVFSIHVTRILIQKNISCAKTGLLLIASSAAACLLLLSGSFFLTLTGALLLVLWSVLRCAAGEVRVYSQHHDKTPAAEKKEFGLTGIYFDTLLQYMLHLLMPLCLSFGLFKATGQSGWIIAGMGAALAQIFLLVMHHAQESALLRKLNHERGAFVLRPAAEQSSGTCAGKLSSVQKITTVLNQALLYPAVSGGLLLFSAAAFFSGQALYLKLFLVYIMGASAALAFYTIARKLKNRDSDKQLADLVFKSPQQVKS